MHLSTENKILIAIVVVTVGLLIGGSYYLTKGGAPVASSTVAVQDTLKKELAQTKGDPTAKVKIVEYADFQCPACAASKPIVDQVLKTYGDKVYFEYHHFPLAIHKWARDAAAAGEAAAQQGKFWEMYDVLYAKQTEWAEKGNAPDLFKQYAKDLGLDTQKFADAVASSAVKDKVQNSLNEGNKLSVQATPTFFVNGKRYEGGMSLDDWKSLVDSQLK
jgi:protein-disulfide isomerase